MCYMIAVGLPKAAHQKWLDKLPQPMRAWPAHYTGLSSRMDNFSIFIVGTGMCSCDLFNRGSNENAVEKYRRKGWSKGKIERAIENRKKSNLHAGLHPELRRWLADAAVDAGEAYLFVHWDSDALNYEQQLSVSAEEMREQRFHVKDEQLIHIRRG